MKRFLFVFAGLAFFLSASTQTVTLKKVMSLTMARTADDDMPGTRGASIAWHPLQKKYYAAMAGNIAYPLCIFDVKGQRISPDSQSCNMDVRGLWYNAVKK